jgi:hypothetical protein
LRATRVRRVNQAGIAWTAPGEDLEQGVKNARTPAAIRSFTVIATCERFRVRVARLHRVGRD